MNKISAKPAGAGIQTRPIALSSRLLALEPRYVFDAALGHEVLDSLSDAPSTGGATGWDQAASTAADIVAAAHAQDSMDRDAGLVDADGQVGFLLNALVTAHNLSAEGREIAFIETRLSDLTGLVGSIPEGVRIVFIDSNRDGVQQMADALGKESGITGIHIISHGSAGSLQLGNSVLDAQSMTTAYADELASIRTHLAAGADILVYGCNFGAGEAGAEAAALLSRLTGADIASSDDLTGADALGGDWDLEKQTGSIEAGIIEAMKWNGVLDPFNISATTAPVVRDNTGTIVTASSTNIGGTTANRHITDVTKMVGATVLWQNAGFVGAQAIDLRATVLSVVDTNPNSGQTPGLHFTINGDDPSVRVDNAEVRIRWDAYNAGTYDPLTGTGDHAIGDVGFFIRDIDAQGNIYSGGQTYLNITGVKPQESVRADLDELSNYQTEALANTHLTVGLNIDPDTGGTVTDPLHPSFGKITATNLFDTESAQAVSGVKFNWNGISSWEVTYRVAPPPGPLNFDLVPTNGTVDASLAGLTHGQRFFDHDGDGDLTFASAYTVDMRHLDLDGNDSTAAGDDYQATFTENGAAVSVVDTDVDITGLDAHVESATVVLTNAKPGDQLLVGGSAAASGTVNGLAYSIVEVGGVITVQLTGSTMDPTVYETALKQITFNNTSENPDTTDRVIEVSFNNGTVDSNTAISTISVTAVNDPPAIDLDGPLPVSDGTLPASPPNNAWQVALYGGLFGVAGSADPISEGPNGAPGTPVLHGVGYSAAGSVNFNDPNIATAENPRDSIVASGFSYVANPTNGDYAPGNGVWTIAMSRTLTESATITIGAAGEYFDDHAELFVNGVRVEVILGFYASLPASEVISYNAQAGDVVEVRLTNIGSLGGFTVSLATAEQANDLDHEVTFTEGDAPIPITLDTKADAADADDDITSLAIATNGVSDGAAERVMIGGQTFALDTGATHTVSVGGTTFEVAYTTSGGFAITRSAGGTMPQADLDTLIRSITYENTSQDPTAGDRTLTFVATDSASATSAPAISTIHVVPVNDPPIAVDDTLSTDEDMTLVTNIITLNGIDSDPDGDPLTIASATIDVDGDGDQDPLTLGLATPIIVGGNTIGTLTLSSTGALTFDPAFNFHGATPPITYTLSDGNNQTDTAVVLVTVNDVNDPPVATPSTSSGDRDTNIPVDLTGTDVDGTVDFVTVTTLPPATQGVLYLADGVTPVVAGTPITAAQAATLVFVPATNFSGDVTIPFTVTDDDGTVSAPANEVITVNDVNDPPVATPSTSSGDEDTNIPVNLTGTDPDGTVDFVTVTTLPPATQGVLYLADGVTPVVAGTPITAADAASLVFVPATNFNGIVTIPFTVTDNDGGVSTPANEVITVNDVNDPPVATPSTSSGDEDTNIPVNLTGTDPDGTVDFVTVTTLPPATQGMLYLADGVTPVVAGTPITAADAASLVFVPATNFNGDVTIPFTVTDDDGGVSAPANEVITVNAINDAIVDGNEARTFYRGFPLNVPAVSGLLANATDPDGDTPQVTSFTFGGQTRAVSPSTPGSVSVFGVGTLLVRSDGSFVFTPVSNIIGAIPVATYTISDGEGSTDTSTLTLIAATNRKPVDGNEVQTVVEDTPLNVPAVNGLLANATDANGDPLQITKFVVKGSTYTVSPASPGTAVLAGIGTLTIQSDGSYSFTPAPNYAGAVPVVTYTISDGYQTDTSTLTLKMQAVNDAVIDGDEVRTVVEDVQLNVSVASGLLANAVDPEGNPIRIASFTVNGTTFVVTPSAAGVANIAGIGTLRIQSNGAYLFTPVSNFDGPIPVVTYTVTDSLGATDTSTLTLTMQAVNDRPTAVADSTSTPVNTPVVVNLTANDIDPDNDLLTVVSATVPAAQGALSNVGGVWTFTPATGFNGEARITYTIEDAQGERSTSTHSVFVGSPPLVALPGSHTGLYNSTMSSSVAGNDTFSPGSTFSLVTPPPSGSLVLGTDGRFRFTPTRGFSGTVTFTYQISDQYGQTVTAVETIRVLTFIESCFVTFR